MKNKLHNKLLSLITFAATASPAMAAFTPITSLTVNTVTGSPDVITLLSLTTSLGTVPAGALRTGTSASLPTAFATIGRMDDFNLNSLASGFPGGTTSVRTVLFGGANFTDTNGSSPDFFLFEAGADPDDITIAAIFANDTLGVGVAAPTGISPTPGWGNTGRSMTANALQNSGQIITGVCWDITDLKDAAGNPLAAGSTIKGIAITNGFGVDIGGFYALAPPAAFDRLAVAAPSPQPVGTVFDVTITAQDAGGVTFSDSTTTISISGLGTLPAGSLMEFDWNGDGIFGDSSGTLVNGVKVIKARNNKAQTVTLTASAGATTTPLPPNVVTTVGAYAKLQILAPGEVADPGSATGKTSALPTTRTLNVPFNVTVNAVDSFWNPVAGSTPNTIGITSNDPLATLPSPASLVTNGPSFNVTLNTLGIGSLTLTATDTTDLSKTAATTSLLTVLGVPITWVGDGTANVWNTTPSNLIWNGGTVAVPVAVAYANTNQVTFGATGVSVFPAVTINSTVTPSKITVNNTLGASNYTFEGSGSIAGVIGGFTKSGSGLLTVSTSNSYTGPTAVTGGVMILNNSNALPAASALTLSGGLIGLQDLDFTRSPGLGAGQVNIVSGGFAAFGTTGVVNLGGNPTPVQLTIGSPTASPGFFETSNPPTLSLSHVDATMVIDFRNPIALRNGTNFFQVADSGSAIVDAILSGAISTPLGGIGLSKTGDGTLMLTNTGNTFNGCFIDFGTIMLGAANVLPDTATFTVKRGGASGAQSVIDLNGFSDTLGTLNLGDAGAGNGGTPSVINSDVSTPAKAAAVLTLNGGLNYNAGAVGNLYDQASISANLATGTAGNRNITVGDGSAVEDLVISGSLTGGAITKAGLGVLVLANPLYSGNTTISAGKLIVREAGAQTNANPNNDASTVTITAGATLNLEYAGTDTVRSLVIGANLPLASGVYGAAEFPGVILGTGTITVLSDPYLAWAGAGVPFDGDANNDGVQNGLAWLLGAANPTVSANGLLPVPTETGGSLKMTFNMLNAASRGTSAVEVQHSSDLGISDPWTGVPVPNTSGGPTNGVTFVITPGSPLNGVQATVAPSEAAGGKVFSRLKGLK